MNSKRLKLQSQFVTDTTPFTIRIVIWPIAYMKVLISTALNGIIHFCEHQKRNPSCPLYMDGSRQIKAKLFAWLETVSIEIYVRNIFFPGSRWLLCPTGTLAATTAQRGTTLEFDTRSSFWPRQVSVWDCHYCLAPLPDQMRLATSFQLQNVLSQGSHSSHSNPNCSTTL